jgi:hypothetical protein
VLKAVGDGTHVSVVTDLSISGKVAQFGRGVLAEVSAKLLDQFVHNLESTVLADQPASESGGGGGSGAGTTSLAEARTSRRAASRSTGDGESGKAGEPGKAAEPGKAGKVEESASSGKAAPSGKGADSGKTGKGGVASELGTAGEAGPAGKPSRAGKADSTSVVDAPSGGSRNGRDDASDEEPETSHASHQHDEHPNDGEDDDVSSNGATVRKLEPRPVEPVDLIEFAGPSLMRRLLPAALAAVGLAALAMVVRRLLK